MSILTGCVHDFMASYNSKTSRRSSSLTRFPLSVYTDYSARGSLSIMLKECVKFKIKRGWKSFDWKSKSLTASNAAMIRHVAKKLRKSGFLQTRVVFISSRVPKELKRRIVRILSHHDIEITDDMKVSSLVVTYDKSIDDNHQKKRSGSKEHEYRVLELNRENDTARVHWLCFPDRYDQWIPMENVSQDHIEAFTTSAATENTKVSASLRSFVSCRYVLDLHKFNEWPNVKDYCVDQRLVAKTQIRFVRRQEKLSRPIKIRLSRKNRTYRILEISGGPFYDVDFNDLDSDEEEEEEEDDEEEEEQDEISKTTSKRKRVSKSSDELQEEDVARPKKQQRRNDTILFVSDENGERWNEIIENETKISSHNSAVSLNTNSSSWFDKEKIHFKERLELPEWFDGMCQCYHPSMV